MSKYLVINTYKYTAELEIEAESKADALKKALGADDEHNNDDWLFDSTAEEIDV